MAQDKAVLTRFDITGTRLRSNQLSIGQGKPYEIYDCHRTHGQ